LHIDFEPVIELAEVDYAVEQGLRSLSRVIKQLLEPQLPPFLGIDNSYTHNPLDRPNAILQEFKFFIQDRLVKCRTFVETPLQGPTGSIADVDLSGWIRETLLFSSTPRDTATPELRGSSIADGSTTPGFNSSVSSIVPALESGVSQRPGEASLSVSLDSAKSDNRGCDGALDRPTAVVGSSAGIENSVMNEDLESSTWDGILSTMFEADGPLPICSNCWDLDGCICSV
jgi:hypothetical protein